MHMRKNPRFFTDVTRKRYAAGTWVAGGFVAGAATSSTIKASVQPATGRDLLRLNEGLRTRDVVKVFAALGDLRTADETAATPADRVVHLGEEYEVVEVEAWAMAQMPHVEALAVRADRAGVAAASSP